MPHNVGDGLADGNVGIENLDVVSGQVFGLAMVRGRGWVEVNSVGDRHHQRPLDSMPSARSLFLHSSPFLFFRIWRLADFKIK